MALTPKEKELAAVGISVAAGCRPCTSYHVREVRKAGATDPEIRQAIENAVRIREDATEAMQEQGLRHLGGDVDGAGSRDPGATTRVQELVAVGAAFAVNCTSNLEKHLEADRHLGITDEEIREVVTLSTFIKKMAASHVEKVVGVTEATGAAPGCCS